MTKSIEALERLNNFISREKHINSERNKTINECVNTIKQDLERLELIEALYNKSLKEMENIKDVDRELYLKYIALEKEKEKLIEENYHLNHSIKHTYEAGQEIIFDLKDEVKCLKNKLKEYIEEIKKYDSVIGKKIEELENELHVYNMNGNDAAAFRIEVQIAMLKDILNRVDE